MGNHEEKTSLCALAKIFGFEPKTALALISGLGSAQAVFRLSGKELDAILGPRSRYKGAICTKVLDEASALLDRLSLSGTKFIGWTEPTYPELLKECPDAPVGLYVKSDTPETDLWKNTMPVAVIGTRDISPYGREWCEKIVHGLASASIKPVIISGLAIGTDICAHKTALECGLPTIAVMATGTDTVYPHRHKDFAEKLSHVPGCALVTDYPPGTAPLQINFLRRNRIIAGLSRAAVLIESKVRGGGMMTCRLAFSYDREVYALPGRADDMFSQGCNHLIRSKIAEPLTSVADLIDSLGLRANEQKPPPSDMELLLSAYGDSECGETIGMMADILSAIRGRRGITVDKLGILLGIPYGRAANLTGLLEAEGFISSDLLRRCSIAYGKFR